MIYFCYFLFFFLGIRLLVSLVNFLSFRYLPLNLNLKETSLVSVLIPARNEEQNIGKLLNQLIEFNYPKLEIIIYNDNSTDNTASILNQYSQENKHIRIIEGGELAKGWLGKNHACYHLAKEAKGENLLFIDADVNVQNGLIEQALSYLQKHQLHLLSIFPKQNFGSLGEKVTVPLMNWILLSLLPLILIRKSKNPAFSAANGQFMLFNTETYKRMQPHKLFRNHKVEDIATIKYFKEQGLLVDTLLGTNFIACRMYSGFKESVNGFTKNIFQFFGNSILLTIFVGLITTIAPFLIFYYLGSVFGSVYLIGIVFVRVFVSIASKQSVWENIFYMLPQHIVFLLIIVKGIKNHRKKELIWKGRNIL